MPSESAGHPTLRTGHRVLLAASLALMALSPYPGYAANITLTKTFLDSVGGFVNFAKPTLGSGSNAITNNLQPGDTVFLDAQTRASLILVNLNQGTAANPITVTNTGGQFIIDYPDPAPSATGVGLWGAQHVRFVGTAGSGYTYGIKINRAGSMGIKVDYNQYQQGRVGGTFGNSVDVEIAHIEIANVGFAGIQAKYEINTSSVPAGYTALLDGLEIHDCRIHDTGGEGMYLGWTSDGHPDIANVSVHDNVLTNTGWDGIQLNRTHGDNEIYNNTILGYGLTSNTYSQSLYYYQGSAFSVGRIENFKLHHNYTQATGQYSAGAVSLFFTDTTSVYDNVFVLGSHGAPTPQPGLYVSQVYRSLPGVTLTIANNTFVEPDNNGIQFSDADNLDNTTGAAIDEGGVNVPVTIINNIIAHPISGAYVVDPAISTPTKTTNLFVNTLAGAGFVSSTDFHLAAGSAAIDTGTTVASVSNDFDYVARPVGAAYDKGAYEYEGATPTENVLTPAAWGQSGSGFCSAAGAFDEQPTWNSTTGAPSGLSATPHSSTNTAYASRYWHIDFGANWAKVRITQMWTRYRPNSPGSFSGFASLWWDNDVDTVNDGTTATGLNFATAQNVANISVQQWLRDRNFTGAPITPLGRYLVISTGATVTDRPNEFLFVGYTLP